MKLVNAGSSAQAVHLHLTGVASVGPTGTAITLSGKDPSETNTLTDPKHLVPVTSTVNDLKPEFDYTLPPYSVVVLQIPSK